MDFLVDQKSVCSGADNLLDETLASLTPELASRYKKMVDWYKDTPFLNNAIGVDAHVDNFCLLDKNDAPAPLDQLLKEGPVVIVVFRGDWCGFCNYYMDLIQKSLGIFKDAGASFFAITPQTKFTRGDWLEISESDFHLVSDPNHEIIQKFGLVYDVPDCIKEVMLELGVDLEEINGNWQLPLTGAYIIGQDGRVAWRDLGKDFVYRTSPAEILAALTGEAA